MIRVGHGLTLHGRRPESLSRRHHGQDWRDGAATPARITAREVVAIELSDSFGYDCRVESEHVYRLRVSRTPEQNVVEDFVLRARG